MLEKYNKLYKKKLLTGEYMKKFLVISILLTISACSMVPKVDGVLDKNEFSYVETGPTPYTSEEELEGVTNYGSDFVHWKVARAFAIFEFENEKSKNSEWASGNLSTYPILIYDGNGKPKVYEFRVIVDGKEIGAVSCTAQKKDGLPVTHLLDFAKDYSKILTKGGNAKLVTVAYPSKIAYTENFTKAGAIKTAKDVDTDEDVKVTLDIPAIDFLTNATKEMLEALLITNDEMFDIITNVIIAETESNRIFWEECKKFEEEMINTPVDEIVKSVP